MIRFSCPHCGNRIAVQPRHAGAVGACSKCQGRILVPSPAPIVETSPAPNPVVSPFDFPVAKTATASQYSVANQRRRKSGRLPVLACWVVGGILTVAIYQWLGIDIVSRINEQIDSLVSSRRGASVVPTPAPTNTPPIVPVPPNDPNLGLEQDHDPEKPQEPVIVDEPPDAVVPAEPVVQDRDETTEGKRRLAELARTGMEIKKEVENLERESRPLQERRLQHEANITRWTGEVQAWDQQVTINTTELDLRRGQLFITPQGVLRDQLLQRISYLERDNLALRARIAGHQQLINGENAKLQQVQAQLAPFFTRLAQQWSQMEDARTQWVDLRQLDDKYVRGDYEDLRRALDDWLLIDGLWPAAQCWGALCAYELDDHLGAMVYLTKLRRIQAMYGQVAKFDSGLEALEGLVLSQQPDKNSASKQALDKAAKLWNKSKTKDGLTVFLVGRAYADRPGGHIKAKASFQKSLKSQPNNLAAKVWIARLQTTSDQKIVRDIETGTTTLEEIWKSTGQRSWRLAMMLAVAYRNGQRSNEAALVLETALKLAPPDQHDTLRQSIETPETLRESSSTIQLQD